MLEYIKKQPALFMCFILNILNMRIFKLDSLRLMWKFRHLPIYRDGRLQPNNAALVIRTHGFKRDGSGVVRFKDPKCLGILFAIHFNEKTFNSTYMHEVGHYLSRKKGARAQVQEWEVMAWEEAVNLSKQMNIPFDFKEAQRALNSYGVSSLMLKSQQVSHGRS